MTDRPDAADLAIHLDLAGLAALLKAVEAAMVDGRGQLVLRGGSAAVVSAGGTESSPGLLTVTFSDAPGRPGDFGKGEPDPEPVPSAPVLETQR